MMNAQQKQYNSIISGESFFTLPSTAHILIDNANFRPNQHRLIELTGLARFEFVEPQKSLSFNDVFSQVLENLK